MTMTKCPTFGPATDGIDHVNIYSRARTEEGKVLSNFARTPFTMHGQRFESVEGFYQSLLFDQEEERRQIAGMFGGPAKACQKRSVKKIGDPIRLWDGRVVPYEGEEFDEEIRQSMREKLRQNPTAAEALRSTERLPLTHYYVMWGRPLQPKGERGFLADCMTALREELREGQEPLSEEQFEALVKALGSEDERTRFEAARGLAGRVDPSDEAAVQALAVLLADPSLTVRHRALRTLVQIDLRPEDAEPIYRDVRTNESPAVRKVAESMLARLCPQPA